MWEWRHSYHEILDKESRDSSPTLVTILSTFLHPSRYKKTFQERSFSLKSLNILTWPSIIFATAIGARNPAVLATQLVIPIKVPAKLGAISI